MLRTMSLRSATAAGVSNACAPCAEAQPSALPGVCVQTLRGKPARATFAAMREPMMPRPRKPIRSDMAESSSTGRFDAYPLAGLERAGELAGQSAPVELVAAALPRLAAVGPSGRVAAALGDQREGHLRERFDLPHDAVAAAMEPAAAGAAAQGVLGDAQREFALERLDGRVQGVAHRDVHAARAVGVRAGALAAAEGLVVGEERVPEREVVHRALAERPPERLEHEVGDARG